MRQKTTTNKTVKLDPKWHLVDLSGLTLGRACTKIAGLLMGKGKPTFSYHIDNGDYVVAINASQVQVTGKKDRDKLYQHYTGYAGNLKEFTFLELMDRDPALVIKHGVNGMIPKNRLRDLRLRRLKIFANSDHPYTDKLK